jgi:uncharacterized protein
MKKYVRTKAFNWLKDRLNSERILLLIGPRQVGKTTLLKQFAAQCEKDRLPSVFFTLEDVSLRTLLDADPKNLFQIIGNDVVGQGSKILVCIDEIQYLQNPSNFLKYIYDMHAETIKLVVTGSSAFYIDQKFSDSLAGRKYIYEMMSLSFSEFLDFKDIPLVHAPVSLLNQKKLAPLYTEYLTYGGYPSVVLANTVQEKKEILKELANSYTKKDVLGYDVASQSDYLKVLKVLASQVGGLMNVDVLANITDIPRTTLTRYLEVMQKAFHIAIVTPWFNNQKKELKKMPKAFFLDMGLRNFLVNNFEPYDMRVDKGQLLENAVYLALRARVGGDAVQFWRTALGDEVDFVIPDEKKAYEVKQSLKNIENKKYDVFRREYSEIVFSFITRDSSMVLWWEGVAVA